MARPARIEFPGATYHVMSHGVHDTSTFVDDMDRRRFLMFLREFVDIGKLIVHAFVLMTNHFHLLCETPCAGLSRLMQRLLETYTKSFNSRYHRQGHLWRARYKAVLVQDGEYFLHCSRYIHLNPVKSHLCSRPEDCPWSSYPLYLGLGVNSGWINTAKTLDCFASLYAYTGFVLQGLQQDLRDPFRSAIGGLIFGSKRFATEIGALVRMPQLQTNLVGARSLASDTHPSADIIRAAVGEIFPGLSECQRLRMFTYAMRRFSDQSGKEIAAITGRCPSAVTHAWREIQTRLAHDHELRQRMQALARVIAQQL
jgi:putative transposase